MNIEQEQKVREKREESMETRKWNYQILKSLHERQGGKEQVVFATGMSPSGPVHLGTLREIVLSDYLSFQYRQVYDRQTKVVLFVDDHDPLTKIPQGWPLPEEAIGMKLSLLHVKFPKFNRIWEDIKQQLGNVEKLIRIDEVIFLSDYYSRGMMNESIKTVLQNKHKINTYIKQELSPDTKFLPVYGYDKNGYLVNQGRYKNNQLIFNDENIDLLDGGGKLAWKIDWPTRWNIFGVDFEACGKDVASSLEAARWVSRNVYSYEPPVSITYEYILNDKGQKLSKSKGDYTSIESIVSLTPIWNLKHWILLKPKASLSYSDRQLKKNVFRIVNEITEFHRLPEERKIYSPLNYIFDNNVPTWDSGRITLYKSIKFLSYLHHLDSQNVLNFKQEVIKSYLGLSLDNPYDGELLKFLTTEWLGIYSEYRTWTDLSRYEIKELQKLQENLANNYKDSYIKKIFSSSGGLKKSFYKVTSMSLDGGIGITEMLELNGRSVIIDVISCAVQSGGCYVIPWSELRRNLEQS